MKEEKSKYYPNGQIRPTCVNDGCSKPVSEVTRWKNRTIKHRHDCNRCHSKSRKELADIGITQHKKNYCENQNGKLGFPCTTTEIIDESQLELDHIDGNRANNTKENTETLCTGCHRIKTKQNKDQKPNKYNERKYGNVEEEQKIFGDLFTFDLGVKNEIRDRRSH